MKNTQTIIVIVLLISIMGFCYINSFRIKENLEECSYEKLGTANKKIKCDRELGVYYRDTRNNKCNYLHYKKKKGNKCYNGIRYYAAKAKQKGEWRPNSLGEWISPPAALYSFLNNYRR